VECNSISFILKIEDKMKRFMVQITLPAHLGADFMEIIPYHRIYINELMERGVISTYAINVDRTMGWINMNGKTAEEIESYVEKFPIFKFLTYAISELMIFDNEAYRIPKMSLN
jgi:aspartate 1-decarboxylase